MKMIALLLAFSLLLSAASAFNVTSSYIAGGWLQVTRNAATYEPSGCLLAAITGACGNTGAVQIVDLTKSAAGTTAVSIELENIGRVERMGIEVTESLSAVPQGALLQFEPAPSRTDGRTATWEIASLKPGQKTKIGYAIEAIMREGFAQGIPELSVASLPPRLSLSAPQTAVEGKEVILVLKSQEGKPLPQFEILVSGPGGESRAVRTDSAGKAAFVPRGEGFYTYSVEGYSLFSLASTEVLPEELPDTTGAALGGLGKQLADIVSGLLPVLLAVFVVAVVALIIYGFFTTRKEEEEYYRPSAQPPSYPKPQLPSTPQAQGGPYYSQSYAFTPEKKPQEGQLGKDTQTLVEERKKLMQEESPEPDYSEKTTQAAEADEAMAELEKKARLEGELAQQEEEIEKAIAELEEIRRKLSEKSDSPVVREPDDKVDEPSYVEEEGETMGSVSESFRDDKRPVPKRPVASKPKGKALPKGKIIPKAKPFRRK